VTSRLSFEPVSLEKVRTYGQRFFETPQKASDYSLVNLWGWQPVYDLHWAWDDPLVWILQHHADEFRFVNREQDLDHPGLRKAKLSYYTIDFVRKFRVVIHHP